MRRGIATVIVLLIATTCGWIGAQFVSDENRSIVGLLVAEKINVDLMMSVAGSILGFAVGASIVGLSELWCRAIAMGRAARPSHLGTAIKPDCSQH